MRLPVPGQAALLALVALSAQMFALSFLRADAAPTWQGLHLESWSALVLVVCFLLAFVSLTLIEKLFRSRSESSKGSAARTVNQDL
jgi:membrane protein implicated in regulation of membrane protease activity